MASHFHSHPSPTAARLAHLPPFAQMVAEVLAGQRDPRQLHPRMTGPAYEALSDRAGLYRCTTRPRVQSVHVSRPACCVVELAAVVCCGPRSRALALRFERAGELWVCTQLDTA